MLGELVELLGDVGLLGLLAITAGLAFAETAIGLDLLVPGEAGMVVAGAAAQSGDHPLALVVLAGALGATAGDCLSYAIGRRWGRRVVERLAHHDASAAWDRAERWFGRWGGAAVFTGRWVGAVRAVVPAVAGASEMPFRRFLFWNVLASVGWAGTVVVVGHTWGIEAARWLDDVGGWTYVVAGVLVVALLVRRRIRRRRLPADGPTAVDDAARRHPGAAAPGRASATGSERPGGLASSTRWTTTHPAPADPSRRSERAAARSCGVSGRHRRPSG